jgi:hypothetical protein
MRQRRPGRDDECEGALRLGEALRLGAALRVAGEEGRAAGVLDCVLGWWDGCAAGFDSEASVWGFARRTGAGLADCGAGLCWAPALAGRGAGDVWVNRPPSCWAARGAVCGSREGLLDPGDVARPAFGEAGKLRADGDMFRACAVVLGLAHATARSSCLTRALGAAEAGIFASAREGPAGRVMW